MLQPTAWTPEQPTPSSLNQQRLNLRRDIIHRKARPIPRIRSRHDLPREKQLHHIQTVPNLHRGRHNGARARKSQVIRHRAAMLGRAPRAVPRPQHHDAHRVDRHEQDRPLVLGRQVDGVRVGQEHIWGSRNDARSAGGVAHVEAVDLAAVAAVVVVGEEDVARRGQAGVPACGGGCGNEGGQIPGRHAPAFLVDFEDGRGVGAHDVGVATGVVLDLLRAAIDAAGGGGEVDGPQRTVRRGVVFDEEIVAGDVLAAGDERGGAVHDDGEQPGALVPGQAAGVDIGAAGDAGEFDDFCYFGRCREGIVDSDAGVEEGAEVEHASVAVKVGIFGVELEPVNDKGTAAK